MIASVMDDGDSEPKIVGSDNYDGDMFPSISSLPHLFFSPILLMTSLTP